MTESERYAWLQLAFTPHIGAEGFAALLQQYGSASAALTAPPEVVAQSGRYGKKAAETWLQTDLARTAADAALAWELHEHCRLLLTCDNDYPALLAEGITPPPVLFLRGNPQLLHRHAVGIVGSRSATPQALRIAREFGEALSGQGLTVVSGMAGGIDTAAHSGALNGSGSTIAVWGTGIDRVYPPTNKNLAHEIAERGLIVSEFPLGTRPLAGNFPRRNRIIAAQSHAVLVVEAALGSGSLITARQAAEMGRDVMAVPGSIDNPHSKGCHKLIKEGAKLVECLEDIVSELGHVLHHQAYPRFSGSLKTSVKPHPRHRAPAKTAVAETAVQTAAAPAENEHPLLTQMGYAPVHPDTLAQNSDYSAVDIFALLTEWELAGIVASLPGGRYQRVQ